MIFDHQPIYTCFDPNLELEEEEESLLESLATPDLAFTSTFGENYLTTNFLFLIPPYQLYQPALVHSSSKSGTTSYFMMKSNQHVTDIHGLATYSINHSSM